MAETMMIWTVVVHESVWMATQEGCACIATEVEIRLSLTPDPSPEPS